jgi:alanyl-tRNA synthetase
MLTDEDKVLREESKKFAATLEEEFNKLREKHAAKIEKEIEKAYKALDKAVELSEKYGIPFSFEVNDEMTRVYTPESFKEKMLKLAKVSDEDLEENYYLADSFWDFAREAGADTGGYNDHGWDDHNWNFSRC